MRLGREVQPALGEFMDGLLMTCYDASLFLSPSVAAAGNMIQPTANDAASSERFGDADRPEAEVRAFRENP